MSDDAFLVGTGLERAGFAGLVCLLRALDSPEKTRNQKNRRGSPVASLMPKSVPSGERKDLLLRELIFCVPFTDGVAWYL